MASLSFAGGVIPMSCPSSDNVMEAQVHNRKNETCANHQPDLSGGERLHIPLVRGDEDEHVDEAENVVG